MQFIKTIRELLDVAYLFDNLSSSHVRSLGFTSGQFDVIATLGNQPPMTCKELAAKTLMVKGNLTVILDGLIKKGLITRVVNPNDGRSALIGLTKEGENTFNLIFPEHTKYLAPICEQFDDTRMKSLQQELNQVKIKLEQYLQSNSN